MNNSTKLYQHLLRMAQAVRNAPTVAELASNSHSSTGAISLAVSMDLLQLGEMTRYFDLTNNAWDIRYDELKVIAATARESERKATLAITSSPEPTAA
ncbi:hypothetical protein QYE80_27365 [Pseudomonas tohonis]|nr:hypothetical protein L682_11120 [Pseudomonas alcaligenes OT 69]MDN4148724.1 hypothetical protein [Pseudomonas tohonis]